MVTFEHLNLEIDLVGDVNELGGVEFNSRGGIHIVDGNELCGLVVFALVIFTLLMFTIFKRQKRA